MTSCRNCDFSTYQPTVIHRHTFSGKLHFFRTEIVSHTQSSVDPKNNKMQDEQKEFEDQQKERNNNGKFLSLVVACGAAYPVETTLEVEYQQRQQQQ